MQLQQNVLYCAQDDCGKGSAHDVSARGGKLTLDLLGVRRASVVSIDLLCLRALVERHKSVQQVVTSGIVVISAIVVGEVVAEW